MLVSELISIIEEYVPGYSRTAIMAEIDYVQREVFASRLNYNRAVDPLTGHDPIITPTQIKTKIADAQQIDAVYTGCISSPSARMIQGDTITFFPEDIGTAFYVRYFVKPTEYTAETIELFIPDQFVSVLEDGVVARIQYKQHGQLQPWVEWKKYQMPALRRKLNANYKWKR